MLEKRSPWPKIILSVVICEGAGILGGLFAVAGVRDWYPSLPKPDWTPPGSVFGPVWTILYAMMGVAIGLIWARGLVEPRDKRAFNIFWVQLALNVAWSVVFFGCRAPGWAYAIIIMLWLAIGATLWIFSKISRVAALLMLPYFLWVTFASTLNFAIVSLVVQPKVEKMDVDPRNGPRDQSIPGATLK